MPKLLYERTIFAILISNTNINVNQVEFSHRLYFEYFEPYSLEVLSTHIVYTIVTLSSDLLQNSPDDGVRAKGQMIYCPESNSLLFIGSPLVDGLDSMTAQGLYLSDIPIHDATRDIILVEEQSKAQEGLKRRMDKVCTSKKIYLSKSINF